LQWIPGKRPQDLGLLKGRLNLDYRASGDPYERHRALEILRPTYELTGLYKCKVSTVEDDAVAARTMIVYCETFFLSILLLIIIVITLSTYKSVHDT